MKLRRLRLMLRDGAALSAFLAMFISGELPLWVSILFLAGAATALLGMRPLERVGRASVLLLLLGALTQGAFVLSGRVDPIIAACSFAALVAAHRMLVRSNAASDGQVLLTSVLMLAGGAALTADLAFALCLASYAVTTIFSLGLGTLEAHAEEQAAFPPLRPALRRLWAGSAAALAGTLLFFVLFPRLSWNVASLRVGRGLTAKTGFTGEVRLGEGGGTLKSDPRTLARIALHPSPKAERLAAYWPATSLDTFDGKAWLRALAEKRHQRQVNRASVAKGQRRIEQSIELLPAFGARTAIGLEHPVRFSRAAASDTRGTRPTSFIVQGTEEIRFAREANRYTYLAVSAPGPHDGEPAPQTDESPAAHEDAAARERALPETLDPRIAALARSIAGDASSPREAAERLERHLRTQYRYTLELGAQAEDPLADFLFVRREGHCEYFATALAVMLRTVGIRARLVTGFYGGERTFTDEGPCPGSPDGAACSGPRETYVLRAGDAHSWTEAHLPGEGYVRFDATPAEFRSAQPHQLWATWVRGLEQVESLWRGLVVDYTIRDQAALAMSLTHARRSAHPEHSAGRAQNRGRWWGGGSILALALAGYAAWSLSRRRRPPGGNEQAVRLREALERALPPLKEPLEETCRRLQAEHHPHAMLYAAAARRYLEARFGSRSLGRAERRHWERRLAATAPSSRSPPRPSR